MAFYVYVSVPARRDRGSLDIAEFGPYATDDEAVAHAAVHACDELCHVTIMEVDE